MVGLAVGHIVASDVIRMRVLNPLTSKEIDLHLQCFLSQVEVLILNYYYIWSAFESGHIARFPGGVHVTVHPHEEQGTFGHPSGKKNEGGC